MGSIIKASPVKPRRKFDATFKVEAVRNWLSSGKSAAAIGRELGLNENRFFAWRQSQIEAVLRENRHLREQRDILKKRWAASRKHRRAL